MIISSDPEVCSLLWIRHLGGKIPQGISRDTAYTENAGQKSFVTWNVFLADLLTAAEKFDSRMAIPSKNMAFIMAAVIDRQPDAHNFLRRFGFKQLEGSPLAYPKYKHTQTIFYLTASEFFSLLDTHRAVVERSKTLSNPAKKTRQKRRKQL